MKNKLLFSGLMLALCFIFFAATAQAQRMQTLYKVTSGLFIEGTKAIKSTEESGIYISIYETAEAKINIAVIGYLGNVGYNYTTWFKHGSYLAGPLLNLTYSTQELRPNEFEATWKYDENDGQYDPAFGKIYLGQENPAIEILFIVYNDDGSRLALYKARVVFYGIIE
jgi:hypothetical protein